MDCRGRTLPLGQRTLIMGILNVAPDSFFDGGCYVSPAAALQRAQQMVEDGADIIDLGGESTRPGHFPISVTEELERVLPVLRELLPRVAAPISIDTTKAEVARQALSAGAHILNDQWALQQDGDMASVAAEYQAAVVLMHNQRHYEYFDLIGDIANFLNKSLELALGAGLSRDKIIIDPGFGFGKRAEQNLELLRRLKELTKLQMPILVGVSRKATIGKVLGLPVEQRLEGTAAAVAVSIMNGAAMVRVHDVKEIARVARMTDAIMRA